MSVSTAGVTTYVHPDLEHEFEYPSPPPPVPDRRLKPLHLRPVPPPPVKPRTLRPSTKELNDRIDVPKGTTSSLTIIQHLTASASNDSTTSTARMMSSRHYCGSLPINTESTLPTDVSHTAVTTNNEKEKPNSKTSHSLNSRAHDDPQDKQDIIFSKPSLNNTKSKKRSTTYFNEATNGLAIRLPAAVLNGSDSVERSDHIRFVHEQKSSIRQNRWKSHFYLFFLELRQPIDERMAPQKVECYQTASVFFRIESSF